MGSFTLVTSCHRRRGAAGVGLATPARAATTLQGDAPAHSPRRRGVHADPIPFVRIGFVGCGNMGTNHIHSLCKIKGAEIRAVCDIDPKLAAGAADIIEKAGYQRPRIYDRGPRDFERLCAEEKIDIVFIATPWEWHVPMALAAMKNGKHAAVEVPIAQTAADCWRIDDTREITRHCMSSRIAATALQLSVLNLVRSARSANCCPPNAATPHDCAHQASDDPEGLWRWRTSIAQDPATSTHARPGPGMWYRHSPRRRVRLPRVDSTPARA